MLLYIFNLMIFDMSDCWSDKLIAIDSRSVCYLIKQLGQTTEDKSCDFQVKVDGVFDWRKVRTVMWSLGGVTLPCEHLVHVSNKQKYTHTHTNTFSHRHALMHLQVHAHRQPRACVHTCSFTNTCAHTFVHTQTHTHTHKTTHIQTHCIHTHSHTHTNVQLTQMLRKHTPHVVQTDITQGRFMVDGVFDWRKVRTVMCSLGGVTLIMTAESDETMITLVLAY